MSIQDPTVGEVTMFAGNFPPRGWAFCDGQLLSINDHQSLYAILGTTYGGDGRTSFGLPDLRGRSPKHAGGSSGPGLRHIRLGEKGGREEVYLTERELPTHSHTGSMHAETAKADTNDPKDHLLAIPKNDDHIYSSAAPAPNRQMHSESLIISSAGGGQSFNVESPYLGVNFIIALEGIFPSRS